MAAVTETVDAVQGGRTRWQYLTAGLAFTLQAIHLSLVPESVVITLLPGVFFLAVAIGQGLLGVSLLFDSGRWTRRAGIVFNSLLVVIWVLTRLVPLAALTGSTRLPIEPLGIAAVVVELTLVGLLFRLHH